MVVFEGTAPPLSEVDIERVEPQERLTFEGRWALG